MKSGFQPRSNAFGRLRLTNQPQATTVCEAAGLQPAANPQLAPTNLNTNKIEKFITFPDVAELLVVSDRTVLRWVERRKLVAHHFGGATRIAADDVINFITRARHGPVPVQATNPLDQKFYTAKDVAEILNVSLRTVRRHIKSKALIAHKFGPHMVRIAEDDLQDFIDRGRRE
jgi:excisionase family DNA binding protein